MTDKTTPQQLEKRRQQLRIALDMLRVSLACGYQCVDPFGLTVLGAPPGAGVSRVESRDAVLQRISDDAIMALFGMTRQQLLVIQEMCVELPKQFLLTMTETLNNGSILVINGVEIDCSLIE